MLENWEFFAFAGLILLLIFILPKIKKALRQDYQDEERLKRSMSDELLYDPKTGTRFSVKQAKSNKWRSQGNFSRIKSTAEISRFYPPEEQILENIANELKRSGFRYSELSQAAIETLSNSRLLANYDSWHEKGRFILPDGSLAVNFVRVVSYPRHKTPGFQGFQMLFETRIPDFGGHYLITERNFTEPLVELFVGKDDFEIDGLNVETIRKGSNVESLQKMLSVFADEKNLEIEIDNGNCYLKTFTEPNLESFRRLNEKLRTMISL